MAYQKLQGMIGMAVIPSDFINIPNVSDQKRSSVTTGASGVTDGAATFTDGSVSIGDIVYDTSNLVVAKVTAIVNDNELSLDNGNGGAVSIAGAANYLIFSDTNKAAVLYVGVAGNLTVEMAYSGQTLTFVAAANGYHPIQVNKVLSTGTAADSIVALW
tara:strand:- start:987 stop:1463 length:477 start_codon:yes stop_codon:yes gene_type:complete